MSAEERVRALLSGVPHELLHHRAAPTAAQVAAARGTPLALGGKALVMKLGKTFHVVAVQGGRRLHRRTMRDSLGVQRFRFATAEELQELTGLPPGCVPPLGHPVFELPLLVDASLAAQPSIVFTMAHPERSARLAMADYLRVAAPTQVLPLTEPS